MVKVVADTYAKEDGSPLVIVSVMELEMVAIGSEDVDELSAIVESDHVDDDGHATPGQCVSTTVCTIGSTRKAPPYALTWSNKGSKSTALKDDECMVTNYDINGNIWDSTVQKFIEGERAVEHVCYGWLHPEDTTDPQVDMDKERRPVNNRVCQGKAAFHSKPVRPLLHLALWLLSTCLEKLPLYKLLSTSNVVCALILL